MVSRKPHFYVSRRNTTVLESISTASSRREKLPSFFSLTAVRRHATPRLGASSGVGLPPVSIGFTRSLAERKRTDHQQDTRATASTALLRGRWRSCWMWRSGEVRERRPLDQHHLKTYATRATMHSLVGSNEQALQPRLQTLPSYRLRINKHTRSVLEC